MLEVPAIISENRYKIFIKGTEMKKHIIVRFEIIDRTNNEELHERIDIDVPVKLSLWTLKMIIIGFFLNFEKEFN